MADPAWSIETRALTKHYGSRLVAVDALDLRVRTGEVYGFIGPNGSGKTTTLRMLLGLVRPTSGEARVLGAAPGHVRGLRRLGALIETPTFYPHLSARNNLKVLARYAGFDHHAVERALTQVKLIDRAADAFQTYSLGMKQRLGVAAALLKQPDLLILDEPTNGLDPLGIADMRTLIQDLRAAGRTVLFSSHQLTDIELLCDRVGMIYRGRLVAEGSVADLCGSPRLLIRATPLDRARQRVAEMVGVANAQITGSDLLVTAHPELIPRLTTTLVRDDIAIAEIRPLARTIEDVFFAQIRGTVDGTATSRTGGVS